MKRSRRSPIDQPGPSGDCSGRPAATSPARTPTGTLAYRLVPTAGVAQMLSLATALVSAVILPACGPAEEPSPGGTAAPDALGAIVYADRGHCASCHGPDGSGGVGPRLADGAVVDAYPAIEDQIAVITNGVEGTDMPAYRGLLTPEEIRAVAEYERTL